MKKSRKKGKRSAGRPRVNALSLGALSRTSDRDLEMFKFMKAFKTANPNATKDDAIGAAEIEFDCPRTTVQRHMKPLEKAEPAFRKVGEILRRLTDAQSSFTATHSKTTYKGLTKRLSVFFSPNDVDEIRSELGAPLALKIAEHLEELERLRKLRRTPAGKPAR